MADNEGEETYADAILNFKSM